jgi:hypothetical protein
MWDTLMVDTRPTTILACLTAMVSALWAAADEAPGWLVALVGLGALLSPFLLPLYNRLLERWFPGSPLTADERRRLEERIRELEHRIVARDEWLRERRDEAVD